MACSLFGKLNPSASNAPQIIQGWQATCQSQGEYPRASLQADGTYDLYCCTSPSEPLPSVVLPNSARRAFFGINLPAKDLRTLISKRRLEILGGKGAITFTPKPQKKKHHK